MIFAQISINYRHKIIVFQEKSNVTILGYLQQPQQLKTIEIYPISNIQK